MIGKNTNPLTNLQLKNKFLIPHRELKKKIDAYKGKSKEI